MRNISVDWQKNTKEEWWINQNKPAKKKVNAQESETLDNETSNNEDSECLRAAEGAEVSHSGAHALG